MKFMGEVVENVLEKTKPGTRPASLELPKPGAKTLPKPGSGVLVSVQKDPQPADPSKETSTLTPAPADNRPVKPVPTPNPNGKSVPLSAETFQTLVTMTQEPWFIKFYAPWCHHCQAMAPAWEQLAKETKGKLNIGEVNCDAHTRLCKDVRLRGYPTILFFRGAERVEYDGLRGFGDLVHYADRAIDISSGVQDVDAASFKALEDKEDVIFVYFYDHATTHEDFMALERLTLSLIGHAKLVKTNDPELYDRFKITTWPRLLVAREGRPTYYTPLTPKEMRDTKMVLNWMKSVWLPIVPELTASNAREIMDGKVVVLGILNRDDDDAFLGAKREMKSAAMEWMDKQIQLFQLERQELRDAKQLRIEEAEDRGDQRALRAAKSIRINMDKTDRKEIAFAWVDGLFWQRWIRTTYGIDAKDGDRVIINDEDVSGFLPLPSISMLLSTFPSHIFLMLSPKPLLTPKQNRRYWDQTSTGNYIIPSRTSILETLNKVTASPPKIKPKLTISSLEKLFFDMRLTFLEHPYLTMGCILGLGLGCASWFRGRLRRTKNSFLLDDNVVAKEFKAPLLGPSANGKVD